MLSHSDLLMDDDEPTVSYSKPRSPIAKSADQVEKLYIGNLL
jgi:hypothetical protein